MTFIHIVLHHGTLRSNIEYEKSVDNVNIISPNYI